MEVYNNCESNRESTWGPPYKKALKFRPYTTVSYSEAAINESYNPLLFEELEIS